VRQKIRSAIGVSITAGHTTLILIPFRAVSNAADFVSPITPCLLAQNVAAPAEPIQPATEAILTIAPSPPCFSICRISCFKQATRLSD
jgi:hypothetical protein